MYLARRGAASRRVRLPAARRGAAASSRTTSRTRVLLALDCANERRLGPDPVAARARRARRSTSTTTTTTAASATVNLVVADASSTAEIVGDLLAELDVAADAGDRRGALRRRSSPTPAASSTRTRRRRRCGSPPSSSRPAPTSTAIFRHVYETVQFAKLKLLARALERAQLLRGRPARRLVPAARGLRRRRAPRSPTPTGSSTTCARPRAPSSSR